MNGNTCRVRAPADKIIGLDTANIGAYGLPDERTMIEMDVRKRSE